MMVKADAYGHGLVPVALATEDLADAFGVATVEEGAALKAAGVTNDVMALICAIDELEYAIEQGIIFVLSDFAQLSKIETMLLSGEVRASDIRMHIALDSGMHRLGFCEEELDELLDRLKACGVNPEGVYSHLRVRSYRQISAFKRMSEKSAAVFPNIVRHLASSRFIGCKSLSYDMVRVGISAYEGAMTVKSTVVAARRIEKGEYVSYGNYKVKDATNSAVVFGGYADGAYRERPSAVYIRGRRCPVIGRVCMDMTVVDCGDFLPDIGEEVVLSDPERIGLVAKERKSINYTVMTCWHGRVERIYDYDQGGGKKGG